MSEVDVRITDSMRNRIQEILVSDGVEDAKALTEANSICDGLGYYHRVTASTGLHFRTAYGGVEVLGNAGDLIETIGYDRMSHDYV
jgi:hypothetical protein